MKFSVAKLTYRNGDLSHPWTAFAIDANEALTSFKGIADDTVIEVSISERPNGEVSF